MSKKLTLIWNLNQFLFLVIYESLQYLTVKSEFEEYLSD